MDFRRKKIQDQQNSGAHFVMLNSPIFPAEFLGKTILSSAEIFLSRSQVHNLCSGVPLKKKKPKSVKKKCNRFGGTGSQFSAEKKSADLMPHNRPQRKKGPQSPQRFVWQLNLRLQCKVLSPRPYLTYWPWVAHVIGRNLPG